MFCCSRAYDHVLTSGHHQPLIQTLVLKRHQSQTREQNLPSSLLCTFSVHNFNFEWRGRVWFEATYNSCTVLLPHLRQDGILALLMHIELRI